MIPHGYCQCGCGNKTNIISHNRGRDRKKGDHYKYCFRHKKKRELADIFWEKVDKKKDCWEWTAGRGNSKYGQIVIKGKTMRAHRVSWEMHNGAIPEGLCVLHKCDNPPCVNPDHLFLGTIKDNNRDRDAKGRRKTIGSKHGNAKLNEEDVKDIRELALYGVKPREIGVLFGDVCRDTITKILRGALWKHC